jgi:hypothetical protein
VYILYTNVTTGLEMGKRFSSTIANWQSKDNDLFFVIGGRMDGWADGL